MVTNEQSSILICSSKNSDRSPPAHILRRGLRIMVFKILLAVLLVLAFIVQGNNGQDEEETSSTTKRSKFFGPTSTRGPLPPVSYCIKHPPNFLDVDLPCGGYDKPSCERVCKQLGRMKAYCSKEEFCLCHNGDLYSC